MHMYSVVAVLENLAYVTLALKIDFYSQTLGNRSSITNTNLRKKSEMVNWGFVWLLLFFFFYLGFHLFVCLFVCVLSSQSEHCKEIL